MPYTHVQQDPTTGDLVIPTTIRITGTFAEGVCKALGADPLDVSLDMDEILEGLLHGALTQGLVNIVVSAMIQSGNQPPPTTQDGLEAVLRSVGFSQNAIDLALVRPTTDQDEELFSVSETVVEEEDRPSLEEQIDSLQLMHDEAPEDSVERKFYARQLARLRE